MNQRVLIRCDGSPELGLGHVVRCLVLADELRKSFGCEIFFAVKEGPLGFKVIDEHGYAVFTMSSSYRDVDHEEAWTKGLVDIIKPAVLVLDIKSELTRKAVEDIRLSSVLIVIIDDSSERRLSADLVFYPPVPQVKHLDWSDFSGICHVGWEWVLLRPEFADYRRKRLAPKCSELSDADRPTVLITMGSSDPSGLTLKAIHSLELLDEDFKTIVILGTGFQDSTKINQWKGKSNRNYEFICNAKNMPSLLAGADLAVVSFGVTAYETAALGIPSIHLSLSDDHAISSSAFGTAGMAMPLGNHANVSSNEIADAVRQLLLDQSQRQLMQRCCLSQPIGDGYLTTSAAIVAAIHNS